MQPKLHPVSSAVPRSPVHATASRECSPRAKAGSCPLHWPSCFLDPHCRPLHRVHAAGDRHPRGLDGHQKGGSCCPLTPACFGGGAGSVAPAQTPALVSAGSAPVGFLRACGALCSARGAPCLQPRLPGIAASSQASFGSRLPWKRELLVCVSSFLVLRQVLMDWEKGKEGRGESRRAGRASDSSV